MFCYPRATVALKSVHFFCGIHCVLVISIFTFTEYSEDGRKPPGHLVEGLHSLLAALKLWTQKKDVCIMLCHKTITAKECFMNELLLLI